MAYQANKPQSIDLISTSQADILNNFTSLGLMLDPDNGLMKFPRMGSVPATAATTVGLIAQNSVENPGVTALFFAPQNAGAPIDFTTSVQAADGWCRLPCGILLKWGVGNCPAVTTFPAGVNIPVFTAIYNVQVTYIHAAAGQTSACWMSASTILDFETITDGAAKTLNYLAIGI